MTDKPDQADILAQNAQLTADITLVRGQLTAANTQISALTGENTQLKADLATEKLNHQKTVATVNALTSERDSLKSENANLKAEKLAFESAVASKIASLGVIESPKTKETTKAGEKKPSVTEKILAAKGVKTLAELEAKRQPGVE